MEQRYPPTYFDCTEKLTDLNEYLQSYAQVREFVTENKAALNNEQLIQVKFDQLIDCKDAQMESVETQCSPDMLTVEGEITPSDVHSYSRFTFGLNQDLTNSDQANNLETIKAKMQYDKIQPRRKEFDNVILKHEQQFGEQDVTLEEALVSVRVYQPFSAAFTKFYKGEKLKCSQEIVALMSNKLSDLRDKIVCVNDNGFSIEIDDLKHASDRNVKAEYPSGLIGIDDILYIDMRDPNAVDYSEVIIEWATKKKIADFQVLHMDKVEIRDLTFRIGYPYVYQHRGNCEHIFIFSDVKLVKRSDVLCSHSYPMLRSVYRFNSELCNICHSSTAAWLVCECERLPHDRTYLCQECFYSYNYLDGKKIGNFKAYPYYNKNAVNK